MVRDEYFKTIAGLGAIYCRILLPHKGLRIIGIVQK